ncbi:NADH:ubiquinone oxidoreductase [Aliivibrio sp. S3MY1]|uniref:NADH:ubiquinone oxidoreductase n=1 Tax=unclassified Aliivibrio TaxID=2645654 RepID=UPI0023797737|nr:MULTISPECIES: NADH:ubiquinone oxidoreductase [unclassified Aliivibrio]MDD9197224.1 NADH:ubiquinone oxidoreductase [Aliivibrio sp. S3MY1]MDD9200406.1 NADH:ubiquinone oxidoreductase [Aliivibrio sp. S2MY1]
MKLLLIFLVSTLGGVAAAEHFHSFLLGLSIASLAVGCCHWFAFRTTRYPQMALLLLMLGLFSKMAVTIVGVMMALDAELITSPFIFAVSYLFFSIVATYLWFKIKDRKISQPLLDKKAGLM